MVNVLPLFSKVGNANYCITFDIVIPIGMKTIVDISYISFM